MNSPGGSSASAPKPKPTATTRTITCRAKLYATRPPVSSALEFATLSCGRPLGKGVQHNRATVSANAERTQGTFSGSIKFFFNEGALRGTFRFPADRAAVLPPWPSRR